MKFPISKKSYQKIKTKTNIVINMFGHENKQVCPICRSKNSFENHLELMLLGKRIDGTAFTPKNSIDLFIIKQNIKKKKLNYLFTII